METYVINFIVYTAAMVGVIYGAVFVYKKSTTGLRASKNKFMQVEETLSIAPRKTLYVVSAGSEKFLIASDVDKTTLISKLNPNARIQRIDLPDITGDFPVQTVEQQAPEANLPLRQQALEAHLPDIIDIQEVRQNKPAKENKTSGILRKIVNI